MKKFKIDIGNSQIKILFNDKKVVKTSNIELCEADTFGAWTVNGTSFINSEVAKPKKVTNKICESRKLLLGKNLYDFVEDKEKIEISTLLPISQYVNKDNKEKYANMLKGKYTVEGTEGVKTFTVSNVNVRCEGFMALLTNPKLLQTPCYVVELGGVDVSIFHVNGGIPDTNKLHTSESGINIYYEGLGRLLTSHLHESYNIQDSKLMFKKYNELNDDLKALIDKYTITYIDKFIMTPLKEIGYREMIHTIAMCGGGALDLKPWIEKYKNITYLSDSIFSNVIGTDIYDKQLELRKVK